MRRLFSPPLLPPIVFWCCEVFTIQECMLQLSQYVHGRNGPPDPRITPTSSHQSIVAVHSPHSQSRMTTTRAERSRRKTCLRLRLPLALRPALALPFPSRFCCFGIGFFFSPSVQVSSVPLQFFCCFSFCFAIVSFCPSHAPNRTRGTQGTTVTRRDDDGGGGERGAKKNISSLLSSSSVPPSTPSSSLTRSSFMLYSVFSIHFSVQHHGAHITRPLYPLHSTPLQLSKSPTRQLVTFNVRPQDEQPEAQEHGASGVQGARRRVGCLRVPARG